MLTIPASVLRVGELSISSCRFNHTGDGLRLALEAEKFPAGPLLANPGEHQ